MRLMVERLHRLDLGEVLPHVAAHFRDPVLAQPGQLPHTATIDQDGNDHQWEAEDDDTGKFGIGYEEQDQTAHQHQGVAQRDGDRGADDGLQHCRISGKPRLYFQASVFLVETRVKVDQMVKHLLSNIRHHPFANPGHQIKTSEGANGETNHQDKKQPNRFGQHRGRLGGKALVHQNP